LCVKQTKHIREDDDMRGKRLLTITLASGIFLGSIASAATLSDLKGHWAESDISDLLGIGILTGYPDKTFKPDSEIKRSEASKIMSEYIGDRASKKTDLKDIEGHWSEEYINHLVSEKLLSGYPDKTFKPENSIKRAEFAKIISNYLEQIGINMERSTSNTFRDLENHWAKDEIENLASIGYVKGYPDGKFKPDGFITRAEASKVIAALDRDMEKTMPIIKTPWSSSHSENINTLIRELGFKSDASGDWDGVSTIDTPISVYQDNPDKYEVAIVLRDWETEGVLDSYKIPWVFGQVLNLYFDDEASFAYDKIDEDNPSVEQFETSDRFVRLRNENGTLYIYVGYKGDDKFDL
jgi:hypothetical protein